MQTTLTDSAKEAADILNSGGVVAFPTETVYGLAGMMAAVGGILVTSRLDSAQPNAGTSYELDSIAAVVIGGTSLSGGVGTVTGTVIGL